MLRAVVLTQYRRVTDRRTDRRNCLASTALAMRALRRAVKTVLIALPGPLAWSVKTLRAAPLQARDETCADK